MIKPIFKNIYKKIKEYDEIVIARHIGPDPDAVCSQIALRDSIKATFPNKKVYAVGASVARFKKFGKLDRIDEKELQNPLLIICDLPSLDRVDGVNPDNYKEIIKIDHHPHDDGKVGNIDYVDDKASSTCEMIVNLIFDTKLEMSKEIAENLFLGMISDNDRFLVLSTTIESFEVAIKLIKETKIDFVSLYPRLYERPIAEIRFNGYLSENINVTENGLGYLIIEDEVLKKYGVDSATASNMVNDFNFIQELTVWTFATYDEKSDLYRFNIRSRGPIINTVAARFNGGGHKYASGARIHDKDDVNKLIKELDEECKKYKENNK